LLIIADILTGIRRLYQYTTTATAIAATVAMCPAITRVSRTPALSHGSSSSGSWLPSATWSDATHTTCVCPTPLSRRAANTNGIGRVTNRSYHSRLLVLRSESLGPVTVVPIGLVWYCSGTDSPGSDTSSQVWFEEPRTRPTLIQQQSASLEKKLQTITFHNIRFQHFA
jgi:hypothetical protein